MLKLKSLFGFVAAVAMASSVHAYTFLKVVDDSGPLYGFDAPSMNNAGTLIFSAGFDRSGTEGLFTGGLRGLQTVGDSSAYSNFGLGQQINDAGKILFGAIQYQNNSQARTGFYTGPSPATDTYVPPTGDFDYITDPRMTSTGKIVFVAHRTAGGVGVFTGPSASSAAALSSGTISGIGPAVINNNGSIAFSESVTDGNFYGQQLAVVHNGTVTLAVPATAGLVLNGISINDHNVIAYNQSLGNSSSLHTITPDGVNHSLATATSAGFQYFAATGITAGGKIVFATNYGGTGDALYDGLDPVANKIIRAGDVLFGQKLSYFSYSSSGINARGDVAFKYTLSDGTQGLAIARSALTADFNADGVVDVNDLGLLASHWQRAGDFATGDADANGIVDVLDLGALAGQWQQGPASFQAALAQFDLAVPEPTGAAMGTLVGLGLIASQKRRSR